MARIFCAKGRPLDNPLVVHIAGLEELDDIAVNVSAEARKWASRFWPDPLTLVSPRSERVPKP